MSIAQNLNPSEPIGYVGKKFWYGNPSEPIEYVGKLFWYVNTSEPIGYVGKIFCMSIAQIL